MEIREVLKHRYPILMVDKVIKSEYMRYSITQKNVSYNEPWVMGHYPEKPIMPGVYLLEIMAQSSTFILVDENKKLDKIGFLAAVERAKFIRPVFPGDVIVVNSKLDEFVNDYVKISAECTVDGKKVAVCKLSYVLRDNNDHL